MSNNPFSRMVAVFRLMTVEPYVFFVLFGYTCRGVSFQSVLLDRACTNVHHYEVDICDHIDSHPEERTESMKTGNNLYVGAMLTSSLPSIFMAIFLGPWSDKYSRKFPLMLASFGMFAESLLSAILTALPHVPPWLYVAVAFVAGISGGYVISVSASYSYLSDVTDERSRPSRFAVLEFFSITSIVLGSFTEGRVFAAYGYVAVMFLAPCSFLVSLLYVSFFVRDTKDSSSVPLRVKARDLIRLDNPKQSYQTCTRERAGNMRLQIWLLVWVFCSYRLVEQGIISLSVPFARYMYRWGVESFTSANIAFTSARAVVTVIVVPFISKRLRLHEAAIGLVGILAHMAQLTIFSVAYREGLFYYAYISGTFSNGTSIAVTSRLSKLVNKDELGRAFSFLGIFDCVSPMLGSLIFLQIYNGSVLFFPGLAFAAAAVFLLPCAAIFTWMMSMPTVSVGDFGKDEHVITPLEDLSTAGYNRLQEK